MDRARSGGGRYLAAFDHEGRFERLYLPSSFGEDDWMVADALRLALGAISAVTLTQLEGLRP